MNPKLGKYFSIPCLPCQRFFAVKAEVSLVRLPRSEFSLTPRPRHEKITGKFRPGNTLQAATAPQQNREQPCRTGVKHDNHCWCFGYPRAVLIVRRQGENFARPLCGFL